MDHNQRDGACGRRLPVYDDVATGETEAQADCWKQGPTFHPRFVVVLCCPWKQTMDLLPAHAIVSAATCAGVHTPEAISALTFIFSYFELVISHTLHTRKIVRLLLLPLFFTLRHNNKVRRGARTDVEGGRGNDVRSRQARGSVNPPALQQTRRQTQQHQHQHQQKPEQQHRKPRYRRGTN